MKLMLLHYNCPGCKRHKGSSVGRSFVLVVLLSPGVLNVDVLQTGLVLTLGGGSLVVLVCVSTVDPAAAVLMIDFNP